MRKGGIGDLEFRLNVAYDHAIRLGRHEGLQDAESRLIAHGREHVCVPRRTLITFHISMLPEIENRCQASSSIEWPWPMHARRDRLVLQRKDREIEDAERLYWDSAIKAATELIRLLEKPS